MGYKYVIFDMDGTLLNTLEDLRDSVNFALSLKGMPQRTTQEIRSFVGNGVAMLVHRSVAPGTAPETERECLDIFKAHYEKNMANKTAPYPGVSALLGQLRQAGIRTAIVSNKFEPALKQLCELHFAGLLDAVAGQVDEREPKPAPDGVLHIMGLLGAARGETVYVGDSDVDVQTAKNSGLDCIGVTWGFRDRELLLACGAQYIADSAQDVLSIVKA